MTCLDQIVSQVRQRHFAVQPLSADCAASLYQANDWQQFRRSWDHLLPDQYMGDRGRYRARRYQVFEYSTESQSLTINPDQRHYQARDYNRLNGGIYRVYEPFTHETLINRAFLTIQRLTIATARRLKPGVKQWHIEAHQFRIYASGEEVGRPVPEGLHKDGVDFVFVFFVQRVNVRGGVSKIYSEDSQILATHQMRSSRELMVIDDRELWHHVTPIYPCISRQQAYRDVLVLTFKAAPEQKAA